MQFLTVANESMQRPMNTMLLYECSKKSFM